MVRSLPALLVPLVVTGCSTLWGLDEVTAAEGEGGASGAGGATTASSTSTTSTSTSSTTTSTSSASTSAATGSSSSGGGGGGVACELDGGLLFGGDLESATDVDLWFSVELARAWVETDEGCHALRATADSDAYAFLGASIAAPPPSTCLQVRVRGRSPQSLLLGLYLRAEEGDYGVPGDHTLPPEFVDVVFRCAPPTAPMSLNFAIARDGAGTPMQPGDSLDLDSVVVEVVDEECAPCL